VPGSSVRAACMHRSPRAGAHGRPVDR
jgi:hypothetical protein